MTIEVWAQTTGMECHARLPSGRFTVAEDAAEDGILLGGGVEIGPAEAAALRRGRYLIVSSAWGAYTSTHGPGSPRWRVADWGVLDRARVLARITHEGDKA